MPALEPVGALLRCGDRGVGARLHLDELVLERGDARAQALELGLLLAVVRASIPSISQVLRDPRRLAVEHQTPSAKTPAMIAERDHRRTQPPSA